MFACGRYVIAIVSAVSLSAFAAPLVSVQERSSTDNAVTIDGPSMTVPLTSWTVDPKSFITQHRQAINGNLKAATDRATVYRPIPVCRLIDTRGNPAGINIAGPLVGGSVTNVNSSGVCGIPAGTGVAGLSVSFHVFNFTVNNGGFIAFLQQGAPISGVNAVFNTGAQWTAATANISIPDDSGNFEVFIAQSTVHVVVDVNGYYQDLDFLDTGAQGLDIHGVVSCSTPGCKVLEVTNEGNGVALAATNLNTPGDNPAFRIGAGSFNVAGADVGSGTTAFIFQVNTASLCAANTAPINHPMLDGDASALVLLTPRGGSALTPAPVAAVYNSTGAACTNHWAVRGAGALANGAQYSVFIIKSQ
jgi:hypothetical protein